MPIDLIHLTLSNECYHTNYYLRHSRLQFQAKLLGCHANIADDMYVFRHPVSTERREGREREREYWTVLHRDMESIRELYCGETLRHLVMMVILTENRYSDTVSERQSE